MNIATIRNIGALLKVVKSHSPKNDDGAAAIDGAAIDRQGNGSCVIHCTNGAATGSPTSYTVDCKLQDSADGSTGWADVSGEAITQITADDGEEYKDVDLSSVKRYIRTVTTVAFTGGTSPAVPVATNVVLGHNQSLPLA